VNFGNSILTIKMPISYILSILLFKNNRALATMLLEHIYVIYESAVNIHRSYAIPAYSIWY